MTSLDVMSDEVDVKVKYVSNQKRRGKGTGQLIIVFRRILAILKKKSHVNVWLGKLTALDMIPMG